MPTRTYFTKHVTLKGLGTGLLVYNDSEPFPNREWHYQRITVENQTSSNSKARIVKQSAGVDMTVGYIAVIPEDNPAVYDGGEIVVKDNQRLEIKMESELAGDVITITLEGYQWMDVK